MIVIGGKSSGVGFWYAQPYPMESNAASFEECKIGASATDLTSTDNC